MLEKSVRDRDTALACFVRVKLGKLMDKRRGCIYSSVIGDRIHTYTHVPAGIDVNVDICFFSERSQIPESALTSGITGKMCHELALFVQRNIYIYIYAHMYT